MPMKAFTHPGAHRLGNAHAIEWGSVPERLLQEIADLPDVVVLADDKSALAALTARHWLAVPQLALPGHYERVGATITLSIPFTGTAALFAEQPSCCAGGRLACTLAGSSLLFTFAGTSSAPTASAYFTEQTHLLSEWLLGITNDVAAHNAQVDRAACDLFEDRRRELLPLLPLAAFRTPSRLAAHAV